MPQLLIRRAKLDDEGEFMRAYRATAPEVPYFIHYYEDGMSFSRYLDILGERERGVNLAPSQVPSTFLFAFIGDRIVGRVSIRHRLNDVLLRVGGHIGYVVVPEFRRRGHATAILRWAVRFAQDQLGLDRVLVTCDDDNVGSIRTIEKNGGVLENVVSGPDLDKPKRRYWIDVRHGAPRGPASLPT
jgi:predicted acetyltransferase